MARGAVRGAMSAWLGLIALQVVTTKGGSGRIAGAFDVLNGLVERALSPTVAAIPDHSSPAGPSAAELASFTDPLATGQVSMDGSSGHQVDPGYSPPSVSINAPGSFAVHRVPVPQP